MLGGVNIGRVLTAGAVILLSACANNEVILEGERIPIRLGKAQVVKAALHQALS